MSYSVEMKPIEKAPIDGSPILIMWVNPSNKKIPIIVCWGKIDDGTNMWRGWVPYGDPNVITPEMEYHPKHFFDISGLIHFGRE